VGKSYKIVPVVKSLLKASTVPLQAAGVPLLLEKPIATTVADAEAITAAVQKSGIRCVMGFLLRHAPDYAVIKQRFESGELGIPTTAYMQRACTVEEARRLYGRCSVNHYLAIHDTDFVLWVFGKEIESIYTVKSDFRVFDDWNTADHYWNLLKWKNGATASILASWAMPKAHPLDVDGMAMFIGTKGTATVTRGVGGHQLHVSTDEKFVMPEYYGAPAHIVQDGHFADVASGRAEPLITIQDGLDAFKVLAAGDESVRTGQAVQVTL
jgi:predicted dehydrogenase